MNGNQAMNWFDGKCPSHVRNAVSDAYRETLMRQEPLRIGTDGEFIVETESGRAVWCVNMATGVRYGVVADRNGKAWFDGMETGRYRLEDGASTCGLYVSPRGVTAANPGFGAIARINVSKGVE